MLLSMVAMLILLVIVGFTYFLVNKERSAIEHQALNSVAEITDTYEARVVRALREIDTALKLIRFTALSNDYPSVLNALDAQHLLPPALLFTVTIADEQGIIIESTNDALMGQRVFATMPLWPTDDGLTVAETETYQASQLTFTRPIITEQQSISGWVVIAIDADYFVSGYNERSLGQQGMLALVGTDGIVRARRTGNTIYTGEFMGMASWQSDPTIDAANRPFVTQWQGVERYTLLRSLYDFPLSIVVGLSINEQLAPAHALAQTYWRRAAWASGLLLLVLAILSRLSWHLQRARKRVMDERVLHAQRVEHLAFHDALTDLPNRAFLSHLVGQAVVGGGRQDDTFALLFLDLDRFKLINDSLGHEAGDQLLKEAAKRLTAAVRQHDVVARLGGDEFVVLLRKVSRRDQIDPIANFLLSTIKAPFSLAGQSCHVSVSIGIALFPSNGLDEQTLMKRADMAMYQAKQAGKNNAQYYSAELSTELDVRLALESGLYRALENQEFRLFYQSKYDAQQGTMLGMKALLRWQHPTLGLLEPDQFIALAEDNGLAIPIAHWILDNACRQHMAWQRLGFPALTMAVKMTAHQFYDDSFVDTLRQVLADTGIEPTLLELVIAESVLLKDVDLAASICAELKKLAITLVVDEFGKGYISLSDLNMLPLDSINLDASLIHEGADSQQHQQLLPPLVELGKCLSFQLGIKGIAANDHAGFMASHVSQPFQVFYINKSLSAEECYKAGLRGD